MIATNIESEADKQAHNSGIITALFGSSDRAADVQEIADRAGWEASAQISD